jgi:hypothetical protein
MFTYNLDISKCCNKYSEISYMLLGSRFVNSANMKTLCKKYFLLWYVYDNYLDALKFSEITATSSSTVKLLKAYTVLRTRILKQNLCNVYFWLRIKLQWQKENDQQYKVLVHGAGTLSVQPYELNWRFKYIIMMHNWSHIKKQNLEQFWDYLVFGLCPSSNILKNTTFKKLELFPSSGDVVWDTCYVGSVRILDDGQSPKTR